MSGPLAGRRFLVTRRAEQVGGLSDLLRAAGAQVIEAPAIAIEPPADPGPLPLALARLDQFDWVVFTSANAVASAASRAPAGSRWPRIGAVGPATRQAVQDALGRAPDLVPADDFSTGGLASALIERGIAGCRVLLPVSDRARGTLETALRAAGAHVERLTAYRTVAAPGAAEALAAALDQGFDMALFASPSAVESFVTQAGERGPGLPAGVIGPATRAAAVAAGLEVRVMAEPSTAAGLAAALVRFYALAPRLTPRP